MAAKKGTPGRARTKGTTPRPTSPGKGVASRKTAPEAKRTARTTSTSGATTTPRRPSTLDRLEDVYVPTRAAWRRWLARNHDRSPGIWLVFDRKSSRAARLAYGDAVEEALCYGWIDSTLRPVDAERYKQLFTPRKPKSVWSRTNKERVERLIASGLMTEAGLARIDEAKASGAWTALDAVEALVVPPDLQSALAANPTAEAHFRAFSPSARKAYLYWLNGAKRPETRATRLREIVRLAAENRRVPG